jgi:hypothetical protein
MLSAPFVLVRELGDCSDWVQAKGVDYPRLGDEATGREVIAMRHSRTPTLRLVGGTATAVTAPAERPSLTSPPSAEDIALVEAGRGLLAANSQATVDCL